MEVRFDASFDRDLRRIRDADLRRRVGRLIEDVEAASALSEIPGMRRVRAGGRFYRIRVGNYRVGIEVEGGAVTMVRFGHRREIYRRFP